MSKGEAHTPHLLASYLDGSCHLVIFVSLSFIPVLLHIIYSGLQQRVDDLALCWVTLLIVLYMRFRGIKVILTSHFEAGNGIFIFIDAHCQWHLGALILGEQDRSCHLLHCIHLFWLAGFLPVL